MSIFSIQLPFWVIEQSVTLLRFITNPFMNIELGKNMFLIVSSNSGLIYWPFINEYISVFALKLINKIKLNGFNSQNIILQDSTYYHNMCSICYCHEIESTMIETTMRLPIVIFKNWNCRPVIFLITTSTQNEHFVRSWNRSVTKDVFENILLEWSRRVPFFMCRMKEFDLIVFIIANNKWFILIFSQFHTIMNMWCWFRSIETSSIETIFFFRF